MGAWLHPGMTSERVEQLRQWALRAAEQSREYGESEAVYSGYLDTADRASDLLDRRALCGRSSCFAECAVIRMRATERERNTRGGCFYPLCLIPSRRIPSGHIQFHYDS